MECLAYDAKKVAFEAVHVVNVAERIVTGIAFTSKTTLAVVYNDFPALSFVITG